MPYTKPSFFTDEREKEGHLNLSIKVRPVSVENGRTLLEKTEVEVDFEKLYLNPSRVLGVQGKTSKTLLLPTEELKMTSPSVMFNVFLDAETERYVEKKVGTGLLHMTNKRVLFQVKPANLKENYLEWGIEFKDILEVSTGIGFKFSGGPRERLQIKYSSGNEVKTRNFANPIETTSFPKQTANYRSLVPKEWEDAILRQILRTEISF